MLLPWQRIASTAPHSPCTASFSIYLSIYLSFTHTHTHSYTLTRHKSSDCPSGKPPDFRKWNQILSGASVPVEGPSVSPNADVSVRVVDRTATDQDGMPLRDVLDVRQSQGELGVLLAYARTTH